MNKYFVAGNFENQFRLTANNGNSENWHSTWSRFKEGDKEAFATFYNLYIDRLFQYGVKLGSDADTVKDAIQEVFLDLYLTREKNNTNPENLKYYLLLALKRNLIKKITSKRRFDFGDKVFGKVAEPEFSPEYMQIERELEAEVRNKVFVALARLPHKQKEVIYLRFNEAMDYPEIAKLMGISIESVRKQVYRALKMLREMLDNDSIVILFSVIQKKAEKSVHV